MKHHSVWQSRLRLFLILLPVLVWLASACARQPLLTKESNSTALPPPPLPTLTAASTAVSSVQVQSLPTDGSPYACPYCDLHGANFANLNLTNANLSGTNLQGADLRGAILKDAILIGADLTNAQLDGAQFNGASLSHANLSGASLQDAQLEGANLQLANLAGADFSNTDLTQSILGPEIKVGLLDGTQKTFFQNARLSEDLADALDPALADLDGVTRVPFSELAAVTATEPVVCGKADLSKLTSRIYVSPAGTDSASCGSSPTDACQTIAQGINRCSPSGCSVLVAWDKNPYQPSTTVQLRDGVNVYGGCLPQSKAKPEYVSEIQAPPGGVPAIIADKITTGVILQGFQLIGSPATGTSGAASVVLLITNSTNLTVLNTTVVANTGAPGAPGSEGTPGTAGGPASGLDGGTVSACSGTSGGEGGGEMSSGYSEVGDSWDCQPGCGRDNAEDGYEYCSGTSGSAGSTGFSALGGSYGGGNCATCPATASNGGDGIPGQAGANASCGVKGASSGDTAGSFSGGIWTGSIGGDGLAGGNGGGGGGGGAGGFTGGYCLGFGPYTWDGTRGGGGGAGGCGGGGGGGGGQGGAAFGIVVVNSTLKFLNDSRIVGGMGGTGGQGGIGRSGGAGGPKAGPGDYDSHQNSGHGAPGGDGGTGGAGGGGAGGNGGPAIGIALIGSATVTGTGTVYYSGVSGTPGGLGKGGSAITKDACTGPDGDPGLPGLVADINQYRSP